MPSPAQYLGVTAGLAAGVAVLRRRRRRSDPVHAPGHRHRGPDPEVATPPTADPASGHDQPWVRTTHSDSQRRRFRR